MLLNRDDAIDIFQEVTAQSLTDRNYSDKESHPHVICMAGPGTGKSRLADYDLVALRNTPPARHPELATLANHKAALAVHISFNSGSNFGPQDKAIGPKLLLGFDCYHHISVSNFGDHSDSLRICPSLQFQAA